VELGRPRSIARALNRHRSGRMFGSARRTELEVERREGAPDQPEGERRERWSASWVHRAVRGREEGAMVGLLGCRRAAERREGCRGRRNPRRSPRLLLPAPLACSTRAAVAYLTLPTHG
jgi:hypothetical protein